MTPKYRILPIGGGGITPSGSLTITENGVYDVTQYEEVIIDANPSWLCFTALEDNSSIGITIANQYAELYYTFDGVNSTRWYGSAISLNEGESVYIFGKAGNSAKIGQFNMTGTISASGDITSLLNGVGGTNNVTLNKYVFQDLFSGCQSLVKAPRIDMITESMLTSGSHSGEYLFNKMFYNTGLTELPRLPHIASSIGNVLYMFDNMFGNCQSLPAKPDFSYIDNTYWLACESYGMFEGSSIEELDLRGIENVSKPYQFKRTFRGMPNLTSVDLSNLTSITAINYAMEECFKNCVNLNTIKIAVTSTWEQFKTYNWLDSVAQTGDFYNLCNNTTIPVNDPSGIPTGWRNIISERTPTVTSGVSSITSISAVGTITIQDDGDATITRAGICWSTYPNPTVNSTHVDLTLPVSEGSSYQVELNNLTSDTTYYMRSYAQNSVGLSYSEERMFVAQDSPPTSPYIHKDTIDDFNGDVLSTTYFLNNAVINTGIQATANMSLRVKGKYMGKYESNTTVGTWNTNNRDASWRMFIRPDYNTTYYDVNYIRNYIALPELGEDIDYLISPDRIINMNTAVTICSTGQNALNYSIRYPILVDIYTWWVHSLEIFDDNGDTVFNGIAREQNGVVGLYDSVSQQMFTNSNINLVLEN